MLNGMEMKRLYLNTNRHLDFTEKLLIPSFLMIQFYFMILRGYSFKTSSNMDHKELKISDFDFLKSSIDTRWRDMDAIHTLITLLF